MARAGGMHSVCGVLGCGRAGRGMHGACGRHAQRACCVWVWPRMRGMHAACGTHSCMHSVHGVLGMWQWMRGMHGVHGVHDVLGRNHACTGARRACRVRDVSMQGV
eukprot:365169-Chlamydomonas_euryale.AAC.15